MSTLLLSSPDSRNSLENLSRGARTFLNRFGKDAADLLRSRCLATESILRTAKATFRTLQSAAADSRPNIVSSEVLSNQDAQRINPFDLQELRAAMSGFPEDARERQFLVVAKSNVIAGEGCRLPATLHQVLGGNSQRHDARLKLIQEFYARFPGRIGMIWACPCPETTEAAFDMAAAPLGGKQKSSESKPLLLEGPGKIDLLGLSPGQASLQIDAATLGMQGNPGKTSWAKAEKTQSISFVGKGTSQIKSRTVGTTATEGFEGQIFSPGQMPIHVGGQEFKVWLDYVLICVAIEPPHSKEEWLIGGPRVHSLHVAIDANGLLAPITVEECRFFDFTARSPGLRDLLRLLPGAAGQLERDLGDPGSIEQLARAVHSDSRELANLSKDAVSRGAYVSLEAEQRFRKNRDNLKELHNVEFIGQDAPDVEMIVASPLGNSVRPSSRTIISCYRRDLIKEERPDPIREETLNDLRATAQAAWDALAEARDSVLEYCRKLTRIDDFTALTPELQRSLVNDLFSLLDDARCEIRRYGEPVRLEPHGGKFGMRVGEAPWKEFDGRFPRLEVVPASDRHDNNGHIPLTARFTLPVPESINHSSDPQSAKTRGETQAERQNRSGLSQLSEHEIVRKLERISTLRDDEIRASKEEINDLLSGLSGREIGSFTNLRKAAHSLQEISRRGKMQVKITKEIRDLPIGTSVSVSFESTSDENPHGRILIYPIGKNQDASKRRKKYFPLKLF